MPQPRRTHPSRYPRPLLSLPALNGPGGTGFPSSPSRVTGFRRQATGPQGHTAASAGAAWEDPKPQPPASTDPEPHGWVLQPRSSLQMQPWESP